MSEESSAPTSEVVDRTSSGARTGATVLVGLVTVVALIAAVWFGVGWGRALLVDGATADERDAALVGAQQAAINLNTIDAEDLDGSFAAMRSSMTGALLEDLDTNEQALRDQVGEFGTSTSAEWLFGSLTELDTDNGEARALVVLAVTTSNPQFFEVNKLSANMSLVRDGDVWKAVTSEPLSWIRMDTGVPEGAVPAPPAESGAEQPNPEEQPAPAPVEEPAP